MDGLFASLPRLFAIAIALSVFAIAKHLWTNDRKQHAAAVILAPVSIGLLFAPIWTFATLITGAILYAASLVKTTRATIATALLIFGAFCAPILSLY